jgi:hypothetical protein
MPLTGLFSLSSAQDLRAKLHHDFEALRTNPFDPYLGFNFFVTAEHLLDWQYPGDASKVHRTNARKSEILLQIASHIANGGKHFIVEAKHHTSVAGTRNQLGYFGNYFGNYFGSYFGRVGMMVELDGDAATSFGKSVSAVVLAEKLVAYWDSQTL